MLTLKQIKKKLEKLESLEEKRAYLKKALAETKDKKLKKEVEKLLDEILEQLEPAPPRPTPTPTPPVTEAAEERPEPKYVKPAPTRAPEPEKPEGSTLERIVGEAAPPRREQERVEYVRPIKEYAVSEISGAKTIGAESIVETIRKYLRAERVEPENLAKSPGLQKDIVDKVIEYFDEKVAPERVLTYVSRITETGIIPTIEKPIEKVIEYRGVKGKKVERKEE